MDVENLRTFINSSINSDTTNAVLFFGTSDKEIFKADVQEEDQKKICKHYTDALNNAFVLNDEIELLNLSQEDERKNVLYEYDFDEYLEVFEFISQVVNVEDEIDICPVSSEMISKITDVIILLGKSDSYVILYQKYSPVQLVKKDKMALLKGNGNRLRILEEDILRLSDKIHLFKAQEKYYIFNITVMEKQLGFSKLITQKATKGLEEIQKKGLVEDISLLEEGVNDLSVAKKIASISLNSPIFEKNVPNHAIFEFVNKHPLLSRKLKLNKDKTKIDISTKIGRKLFLELMNDDFLHSELTKIEYSTKAKNSISE